MESALRRAQAPRALVVRRSDSVFRPFHRRIPARRLHVCIVTQEYLPKQLNGIGRLSHELGIALASGVTWCGFSPRPTEHDSRRSRERRVGASARRAAGAARSRALTHAAPGWNLENGVWVHRLADQPAEHAAQGVDAPPRIWDFSASVLQRVAPDRRFSRRDIVQMPNWNSEGIAVLEDGGFTSILGLHTPLATIARIDPRVDPQHREVRQLLALERRCYERANGYLACGPASLHQVEQEYGIELPPERIGYVPFGIPNRRNSSPLTVPGHVNVLFVGRLEARKGIDTLLEAMAIILRESSRRRVHHRRQRRDRRPSPDARTARSSSARRKCRQGGSRVLPRGRAR